MYKKKILIVGNSFYPEKSPRSFRTTELAKEFSRQGHDVTLYVPRLDEIHTEFEKEHRLKIRDLGKQKLKKIDLEKGSKLNILFKRGLRRGLDLFLNYPKIEWMFKVKKALSKEGGYDLLITIAVPHSIHWGAAQARTNIHRIAKTWVADCGDPFMGDVNDSFRKMFYFKYFEKNWGKKADYIAVPFEGAKTGYYQDFQKKIIIIPQGFTFPKLNNSDKKNRNVPVFLYSGNINSYRHYYVPFFNLLKTIDQDFIFKVFTKNKQIYKEYLNNILDKVEIHNYISRDRLLQEMQNADFLIHLPYQIDRQKSLKLIDYSYSRTPVLSYKGEEDNFKFINFLKGNYDGMTPAEDIEPYRIENVCQQFLDLVE